MNKAAFTLVEIVLVIILVIGVVALVMFSRSGGIEGSTSLLTPSHELYK